MKTMLKRVLYLMLCIVLMTSSLPVSALAAESGETVATVSSGDATAPSAGATISSGDATAPSTEATENEEIAVTGITLSRTALQVGVDEGEATAYADEDVSTIITMSDYQNSSLSSEEKKTVPQTIVDTMNKAGITPELALIGGDYTDGSVGADGDDQSQASLKTELGNLTGILTNAWSSLPYYAIQGNHDYSGFLTDGTLTATGAYEQDNYIVYLINEDSFPWWQGNYGSGSSTTEDKATVTATANALSTYLDTLDGSKPVIIMSHVPMHWSERSTSTAWYYDNIYANILFDAVNEAAEELDILFLFGHNHSHTASGGDYDYEIGGALSYVAKGESMKVPNGTDGTANYTTETLNFTYMNSGYVGKYAGDTSNCSISAITIDSDSIDIARYTYNGEVYDETIKLTNVETEEPEVQLDSLHVEGTTVYSVGDDLTFTDVYGMVDGKRVDVVIDDDNIEPSCSTHTKCASVDVMMETVADTTNGENNYHQVTVSYGDKSVNYMFTVSDPVDAEVTGDAAVKVSGVFSIGKVTVTNNTEKNSEVAASLGVTEYVSYDITPAGITMEDGTNYNLKEGNWATVSIPVDASWESAKCYYIPEDGTAPVPVAGKLENGYFTFRTNHFSTWLVGEDTNGEWVEIPSGYTFIIDNDGVDYGEEYLIVSTYNQYALDSNETGTSVYGVTATLSGSGDNKTATISEDYLDTAVWTITQNSGIYNADGEYVDINSSGYSGDSANNYRTMAFSNSNNRSWTIGRSGNYYTFTTTASNRDFKLQVNSYRQSYMYTRNESSNLTYELYKKTSSGAGGYACLTGTLEQVYADADETTLTTVLGKVSIQTSTDRSTVDSTVAVTSDMVTWDTEFNGSVAGTYTGTVTYEGQTVGTIEVAVNSVSVNEIELVTPEGAVVRGSSKYTVTGGKLKVTYSDGSAKEVDITLGMVNNDGKTVGTYSGLTVTYGGKTVEGFTLTVTQRAGNNYPEYPNEGAVKVNKTATGIDFQSSGVAQVELSVSGVPMNQGVDLVIIVDTSSSMDDSITFNGETVPRYDVLNDSLADMLATMMTPREDGSTPDIDVAIADFNGYTVTHTSSTLVEGTHNYINTGGSGGIYGSVVTPNDGVITGDATVSAAGFTPIANFNVDTDNDTIGTGTSTDNVTKFVEDNTSGTNYDQGLMKAYDLLAAKKASWSADENRTQIVIFMTDGVPYQYNGVVSYYTATDWAKWLGADYESVDDLPSTIANKDLYFKDGVETGSGQPHFTAEAIKGTGTQFVVRVGSNGAAYLDETEGLGATLYTIGFATDDNDNPAYLADPENTTNILTKMASLPEYAYVVNADEADNLKTAFADVSSAVLMAATNARFVDQMGDAFDIQLEPVNYLPEGVTDWDDSKTITPTIEIKAYDIYTRQDYKDGNCTEDQIGNRKTDDNGNYIYTVLEKVTFTYTSSENSEGRTVYTLTGATSDQVDAGATNILTDGVINGKYFIYNMNSTAVTVNGVTVEAESFHWEVGTVTTTELAISYYVYLTGSMEGTREAGSYDTNTYATLYYENYLGNDCYKDTVSPSLAWESALVKYAFYLVDSNGNPVNANGTVVTFANKVAVTQPVTYKEILLNNDGTVNSISVASLGNLPDGYTLYDDDAVYTVEIKSNSTGNWIITKGEETATTYVMQYDPDHATAYSNELSVDNNSYDYTHTVVWFAVVWTPQCIPDTIVIDYGLPVDITVLTNDMFGDYGNLVGVTKGVVTGSATGDAGNQVATTEADGSYGTAKVINTDAAGNTLGKNAQVIRYTPNTMAMNKCDQFTYSVYYNGGTNNGYYYGTVTVIPATTIYYEDTFIEFAGSNNGTDTEDIAVEPADGQLTSGQWYREGTTDADATQAEDRPGYYSLSYIDANNVYGYDGAYAQMAEHSLDSAVRVHVDANSYATASFSCYGTGFDVISLTSNTTGTIVVQVYDQEGNRVRNTVVDTYYGMEEDGTLSVNKPETIYQVPVIKIFDLEYGKYDVTITATYGEFFDHTTDVGYDLYLDAIRIYDPTGNEDETAVDAYIKDGEAYPIYEELRDNIIAASKYKVTENEDGTVTVTGEDLSGAIFIDCNDAVTSIADYVSYGPNNEVYLANGQSIAFTVDVTENMADVQLGIKVANGGSVNYAINGTSYTVETTTDMYYSIWDYAKDGKVVTIKNVSGGILSLTNIKATFSAATSTNGLMLMSAEDAGTALMMLRNAPVVEEEVPETTIPEETTPEETTPEETTPEEITPEETTPEETTPEETTPEETTPEEITPEETTPEETEPEEVTVEQVVESVKKFVKKLFGWLFG